MSWKNLPHWLRWGIVTGLLALSLNALFLLANNPSFSYTTNSGKLFAFFVVILGRVVLFLDIIPFLVFRNHFYFDYYFIELRGFIGLVIILVFFFLIGIVLDWIYRKLLKIMAKEIKNIKKFQSVKPKKIKSRKF